MFANYSGWKLGTYSSYPDITSSYNRTEPVISRHEICINTNSHSRWERLFLITYGYHIRTKYFKTKTSWYCQTIPFMSMLMSLIWICREAIDGRPDRWATHFKTEEYWKLVCLVLGTVFVILTFYVNKHRDGLMRFHNALSE